jgi:hypothetical protein
MIRNVPAKNRSCQKKGRLTQERRNQKHMLKGQQLDTQEVGMLVNAKKSWDAHLQEIETQKVLPFNSVEEGSVFQLLDLCHSETVVALEMACICVVAG